MSEQEERARVCEIARSWIGTPYHDCAEVKGEGVDCAKLIAMVFFEAGLIEYQPIGDYPPQWFLHQTEERFMKWVLRLAREIPQDQAKPGDLVLYKLGHCYAHGGIILDPGWPTIVHAWFNAKRVVRDIGDAHALGRPKHPRKFFTRW